jgi:molecular chaperone DnaK (HSP70)
LNAKDDGASAKELYVEEIATMVVDDLRKKAEDHLGISKVSDALIAVPQHSNYTSTQEARDAGRMAGLYCLGHGHGARRGSRRLRSW